MKKELMYTITGVLLLAIVVTGSTYAFFGTLVNSHNDLNANASSLNIVYSGSGTFSETITMGADRTEGSSTTVNMYTTSNSVHPLINMYLNINTLTANLAVDGFIWEVCAERSGETPVCNSGNFQGYNSTNNNEVLILSNYRLTNVNTAFTVYLWIDGSKITGDLTDAQFSGYIDARSENFKAKFGQ